jgi:hypothetical protein
MSIPQDRGDPEILDTAATPPRPVSSWRSAAGHGFFDAAALACLFALGIVIVVMLWPYAQYKFRFDPRELLQQYVDSERQATLTQMHRELALSTERDREDNWQIMQRLRASLQFALILLLLEIRSWLMSLAGY